MDFYKEIEAIKELLNKHGYHDVVAIILDAQLSGGTGAEVLIIVCPKLLGLKQQNAEAYYLIEDRASRLIAYANSIALEPKPS